MTHALFDDGAPLLGGAADPPARDARDLEALFERFVAALRRLLSDQRSLALAVSGGGDSIALLELSAAARARFDPPLTLFAATVDHGLRAAAAAEAEGVAAHCARLGVPHAALRWDGPKPTSNLQAAAREARAALLGAWRREIGVGPLALGHTQDDLAETLLMRLARGSGVDGLAAMAEARFEETEAEAKMWATRRPAGASAPDAARLRLIRPLLGESRADLRAFCQARGAAWVEDPSNEEDAHLRSRARKALGALAPLGLAAPGLAQTAARMARARAALDAETAALLARASRAQPMLGLVELNAPLLAAAPREIGLRALARSLEWAAGAAFPPRFAALEALFAAITDAGAAAPGADDATRSGRTLHGAVIAPAGGEAGRAGWWRLYRELAAAAAPLAVDAAPKRWDGRFLAVNDSRTPDGDTIVFIQSLGSRGVRAVADALERAGQAPDPAWSAAPRGARLAAPGLFTSSGALLAAPAAGLDHPSALTSPLRRRPSEGLVS
ncbi:MAG: tRNA lysidine(34) synthetase TilS [Pseudomonadota bacterium]